MRTKLWIVFASMWAGVAFAVFFGDTRREPVLPLDSDEPAADAARSQSDGTREHARVVRQRASEESKPLAVPAVAAPETAGPPTALSGSRLSRRPHLEARLHEQPADPRWQADVEQAFGEAFEGFDHARVLNAHCGTELCRVEFTGDGADNVDTLIDAITNSRKLHGERMIELDDAVSPPVGIAYFSRHGGISLAPPEILALQERGGG
jgi:hypothetical protein